MGDSDVKLTREECEFLVGLLENSLKEAQIEEHRTRKPSYREHVIHQEDLIKGVLAKLRQ